MRTCDQGCNGCDECTDYGASAAEKDHEEQMFDAWISTTGLHITAPVRGCMLSAWKVRAALTTQGPNTRYPPYPGC